MNNAAHGFFSSDEGPVEVLGNPIGNYLPQEAFAQALQRVRSGVAGTETLEVQHGNGETQGSYLINIFPLRRGEFGSQRMQFSVVRQAGEAFRELVDPLQLFRELERTLPESPEREAYLRPPGR